jgi:UDP-3-O-[3-hydroxymyristoyl] glucosamine N-acyltransferase
VTLSRRKSIKLGSIVDRFGGELVGDPDTAIRQVATLQSAGTGEISFLAHGRYLPELRRTRAAAVILGLDTRDECSLPRIVSDNPYAYFAKVSTLLNPPAIPEPGRHRSAEIDKTALIAKSATIGACAVVSRGAKIAAFVDIGAGCYVGAGVSIGPYTRLHANVTVYAESRIGARCIVHSGAVIGADGFGLAREEGKWSKIPQIGGVAIGDDVEIGANTTIDRGALDDTIIEDGVKLDNQIQIAHNVQIGAHTAIAGCVGIAGSARIGSNCTIGGGSAIVGHIKIADNVNISACTLITKSLMQAGTYTGVYPFSNHQAWLRNAAHLRELDRLAARVRDLERAQSKSKKG